MHPEDIANAVKRLSSTNSTDRERAERALESLTAEDVQSFLAWSRARDTTQGIVNGFSGCVGSCMGIYGAIALIGIAIAILIQRDPELLVGAAVGLGLLWGAWSACRFIKQRDITIEEQTLSRLQDPLTSVPLLEWLFHLSPRVRSRAISALERLLPGLKASDAARVPGSARAVLNRIASREAGYLCRPEFVQLTLDALVQVGDESSVKALCRFIEHPAHSDREIRLRDDAARALNTLSHRLEVENQASTLLRPSEIGTRDSLLRPSYTQPQHEPQMLLRPTPGEDSP